MLTRNGYPEPVKDYTYSDITRHIRVLEKETEFRVLTIEIFGDDSAVYLIDIDDNKIARFRNMESFMNCKSLEEAMELHPPL